MQIHALDIPGAAQLIAERRGDQRGSFARWFCNDELAGWLGGEHLSQINHSFTATQGSVRGLHYQNAPHAEIKIVRCLAGAVWDVMLDLRRGSPTFMQWRAVELSAELDNAVLIPRGCAHGFQALSANAQLLYLHTAAYVPSAEAAVKYDEPRAAITWPLPLAEISARDLSHPWLSADFAGLEGPGITL